MVAHVALWVFALWSNVEQLKTQLTHPPLVARAGPTGMMGSGDAMANWTPGPVAFQPTATTIEPAPAELPPLPDAPPPPKVEMPKLAPKIKPPEPKTEWGEKNGKGIALTSSPGKEALSAPKGNDDQAFASRDPEGPGPIPDEPSESLLLPGQGGDGQRPSRAMLAQRGTQGAAPTIFGGPGIPPPPIKPPEPSPPIPGPEGSGASASAEARSAMPSVSPKSPAEPAAAPNLPEGPLTSIARATPPTQLLPISRVDVIGIPSSDPDWWPTVVEALSRPPGNRISEGTPQDLQELAPADASTSPAIQPATVAMIVPPVLPDEITERLGESPRQPGPEIVDALMYSPGNEAREGQPKSLPELVSADRPGGDEFQDALAGMIARPMIDEMAQRLDPIGEVGPMLARRDADTPGNNAVGGLPGVPVPAADSAANTGLESDPFAKIPGVEFRNGKVDARNGRQVKPIRPRLTEAGKRDLVALAFPTILLKVKIDNTGHVTDVQVLRGSGSEAIDMPVYRSLWGWWFEPPTDKNGRPLADVQLVAIHWG